MKEEHQFYTKIMPLEEDEKAGCTYSLLWEMLTWARELGIGMDNRGEA